MGETTGVVYADVVQIRNDADQDVQEIAHPNLITLPIADRVRSNDKVFILRKRQISEEN